MDVIWLIITTVIGGAIIGMLGKMVAPGDRDKIPFWLTVVCGIVGMLAGSYLYWVLFGDNNRSFDVASPPRAEGSLLVLDLSVDAPIVERPAMAQRHRDYDRICRAVLDVNHKDIRHARPYADLWHIDMAYKGRIRRNPSKSSLRLLPGGRQWQLKRYRQH